MILVDDCREHSSCTGGYHPFEELNVAVVRWWAEDVPNELSGHELCICFHQTTHQLAAVQIPCAIGSPDVKQAIGQKLPPARLYPHRALALQNDGRAPLAEIFVGPSEKANVFWVHEPSQFEKHAVRECLQQHGTDLVDWICTDSLFYTVNFKQSLHLL